MAYKTNHIDVNRGTSGILLPAEISGEIWAKTLENSAVFQLGQKINIPGSGKTIETITGDISADWVGETEEKHVSKPTFGSRTMKPYKLATIMLFSNEFRRDKRAMYDELIRRAPYAIGRKVDETVFAGTAPGTGFDVLSGCSDYGIGDPSTVYKQLVAMKVAIATAGGRLNGYAMSYAGEGSIMLAVDQVNRPLFVQDLNADGFAGKLLGSKVVSTQAVFDQGSGGASDVIGFAGDWTQLKYGIVDGIHLDITDQATINDGTEQINLWQRNMFAVRIEAEVGVVVKDSNCFLKITNEVESA